MTSKIVAKENAIKLDVKYGAHNLCQHNLKDDFFLVSVTAKDRCLDSGCGHEHFNNILTVLNIPPISHHTLKLAGRKIGKVMEGTAQASCKVALLEEKTLSMQQDEYNNLPPIVAEYYVYKGKCVCC